MATSSRQSTAVRLASTQDAAEAAVVVSRSIRELCHQDHKGDARLLKTWLANKTAEHFKAWIEASLSSFVAETDDSMQGFALLTRGGELALLYVSPEIPRQGVGKALLTACEQAACSAGLERVVLHSTRTARDFYARHQYVETGSPREGLGMCSFPMAKDLSP